MLSGYREDGSPSDPDLTEITGGLQMVTNMMRSTRWVSSIKKTRSWCGAPIIMTARASRRPAWWPTWYHKVWIPRT